jgi:hypothetical protein
VPQWEYCSIQYQDSGELVYFFYGQNGLEDGLIYSGNDAEKVDNFTSKYVAILGLYGWEAINIIRREDGMEHWYFKRRINASNQYLTF